MTDYIQILLQSLTILIGLYLALFKSYFQEKGKNIATKEDIEEITQKVEKIKNDLNYTTQTKISLKAEEKKTLIEYFESYYQYHTYLFGISLAGIYEDNSEKIRHIEERIEQLSFDYDMKSAKMELLIDNPEFIGKTRELKLQTIELHRLVSEYIGKVQRQFIEIEQALRIVSASEQQEKVAGIYGLRSEFYKELNERKMKLYKIQYGIESEIRKDIFKMLQEFMTT